MTHDEARELIGAAPGDASPGLLAHLKTCPECQAHRNDMVAFDATLRRALELDWQKLQGQAAPAGPIPKPPQTEGAAVAGASGSAADRSNVTVLHRKASAPVAKHKRPRLLAFAASVVAALFIGSMLWLSRPAESLAGEVVTHVQGEPLSWDKTEPVPAEKLDAVLRKSGVNLGPGLQPVVYASSCWFRGHFVPHVVVITKDGPVTVMILLHERVTAPQHFNEAGYAGLLVPAGTGAVAVLSRTPMPLDKPAANVVHALQTAN